MIVCIVFLLSTTGATNTGTVKYSYFYVVQATRSYVSKLVSSSTITKYVITKRPNYLYIYFSAANIGRSKCYKIKHSSKIISILKLIAYRLYRWEGFATPSCSQFCSNYLKTTWKNPTSYFSRANNGHSHHSKIIIFF